jgi:hypothetical protein
MAMSSYVFALLLQVVAMSSAPYQAEELKLQEEDLCR